MVFLCRFIKVVQKCKELGEMKYGYLAADMNIDADRDAVVQVTVVSIRSITYNGVLYVA